jgi:hypothetical protein
MKFFQSMTLFQWLAISVLLVAIVLEILRWRRRAIVSRAFWLGRIFLLTAASVTIALPEVAQRVARALGIGRGADVVLYVFALGFVLTSFHFYSRYVRLQRQVTRIVRFIALREARQGPFDGHDV